jgi:dihydroxyacetone kinase-like protein
MINFLLEDLPLKKGDKVSILVNSLGATPLEELYIIYRKAAQVLESKRISIYRPFIGRYACSLEMAGFSISIFRLNNRFCKYLNHPVWTPFVKEGK